jgi:isopenicillin N synthase-like dioxygenase
MPDAIPVIDVADHLAGRPGALHDLARQFHSALTTVGFMVITGHDVQQTLIDQTFGEAHRLHDLPVPEKLALKLNEHNNGYMAMSRYAVWTSDVNKNDKPDLNEAFFIKRERELDNPLRRSGRRFVGANVWPDEAVLPEFRAHALAYADSMDAFARRMMAPLAVALELPPDWFDEAFSESQFTLRLSHYPPVQAAVNQFGIAPHTDSSFMTFLAQTEVPGLQVRMESGDWLEVPYIPGSFAVNSGDMMKRWTNGRFKSTPHRALPPVGRHRYAIPFFIGPQFDWEIACLPTCTGPDNPPRWPPITYAAWQEYWYDANYDPKAQQDLVA